MKRSRSAAAGEEIPLLSQEKSVLGDPWVPIYESPVDIEANHFKAAMTNLIRQPNINSTVIMRADILSEINVESDTDFVSEDLSKVPEFPSMSEGVVLHRYLDDVKLREVPLSNSKFPFTQQIKTVRRIIPRNPFKDHIINQTCLLLESKGIESSSSEAEPIFKSVLVVYMPHIQDEEETPFYLPPVDAIGILLHDSKLSIHYLPFNHSNPDSVASLKAMDSSARPIRIALRLLQTSSKHSKGVKDGYEKRVNHDLVVAKELFQNRYISLKKKYSSQLVNLWCELTDPKKHVFEDLAIAAFLIELWKIHYKDMGDNFEFKDLGCGNGLLVYILNMEGYKGTGIDARARKSWATYPAEVQKNLLEQVIIPSVLLKPHPSIAKLAPHQRDNGRLFLVPEQPSSGTTKIPLVSYYSSANLLESTQVCTTEEFKKQKGTVTFIIGNHSDELTCWIPLLGFPFVVIPCCSHALLGAKHRYPKSKTVISSQNQTEGSSTYGCLVDQVEHLSTQMGWKVAKEMLRIPSTRNAAIIGIEKQPEFSEESEELRVTKVLDIVAMQGGAEGWVENTMALMKKSPRSH